MQQETYATAPQYTFVEERINNLVQKQLQIQISYIYIYMCRYKINEKMQAWNINPKSHEKVFWYLIFRIQCKFIKICGIFCSLSCPPPPKKKKNR